MALILNIDTATETASIALAQNETVLKVISNENMRDHAAWLHVAIEKLLKEANHSLTDLNAIAVVEGPGSYTGLRVGMATAKGLCYSLSKKLILESSLRLLAYAAAKRLKAQNALLVPMIDARRMEVYTAVYDEALNELAAPAAMILEPATFSDLGEKKEVYFFGSGSSKFKTVTSNPRFQFIDVPHDAGDLAHLAFQKYQAGIFADLAYSEPAYLKEFYTHTKK